MIIFDKAYRMICLYWGIFNNKIHINNILFELFNQKLLAGISSNKVWGSKVCVNLTQV